MVCLIIIIYHFGNKYFMLKVAKCKIFENICWPINYFPGLGTQWSIFKCKCHIIVGITCHLLSDNKNARFWQMFSERTRTDGRNGTSSCGKRDKHCTFIIDKRLGLQKELINIQLPVAGHIASVSWFPTWPWHSGHSWHIGHSGDVGHSWDTGHCGHCGHCVSSDPTGLDAVWIISHSSKALPMFA